LKVDRDEIKMDLKSHLESGKLVEEHLLEMATFIVANVRKIRETTKIKPHYLNFIIWWCLDATIYHETDPALLQIMDFEEKFNGPSNKQNSNTASTKSQTTEGQSQQTMTPW